MQRIRTVAAMTLFLMSRDGFAEGAKEAAESFLRGAKGIQDHLSAESPEGAKIAADVTSILEETREILPAWAEKHSQCTEQLAKVIELFPQIEVWTAQEIRRNIEGAVALPQAEGCYAGRDVVAHPAIVRALVRDGFQPNMRTRLLREIGEAIEHMEEIAVELN